VAIFAAVLTFERSRR